MGLILGEGGRYIVHCTCSDIHVYVHVLRDIASHHIHICVCVYASICLLYTV